MIKCEAFSDYDYVGNPIYCHVEEAYMWICHFKNDWFTHTKIFCYDHVDYFTAFPFWNKLARVGL